MQTSILKKEMALLIPNKMISKPRKSFGTLYNDIRLSLLGRHDNPKCGFIKQ